MKDYPKRFVLFGGRVLDPVLALDGEFDVLVSDGVIEGVEKRGAFSAVEGVERIDVGRLLVCPGFVDVHCHLREPGYEWKETVASGACAAVAGGLTAVCCMPNTDPKNSDAQVTEYILERAARAGLCEVHPIACITRDSEGNNLSPMLELREAGAVAFSDDGSPVSTAGVMRRALEYALMLDAPLVLHEEDHSLAAGFSMNESALSLKMGLKGMPAAAENVMISRDIELAALTGARIHFCHVSTARGVELIRRAKNDGIPVTAEVMPHNITLTEDAVRGYNTMAKVSMPLRSGADVEALLDGLADGTIDCVASDHAPHEIDSKRVEFERASFGMIGFQTMVPQVLARVRQGRLPLSRAVEALSSSPARCLGLTERRLAKGSPAHITVLDLGRKVLFDERINRSKSRNTPFWGEELEGIAVKTFVAGRQVFDFSEFSGEKSASAV